MSSEKDAQKDFKFAKWLSKNKKLQGIPPSAFFSKEHKSIGEPYIRFCFIKVCFENFQLLWPKVMNIFKFHSIFLNKNTIFSYFQNDTSLAKAEEILQKWKTEELDRA